MLRRPLPVYGSVGSWHATWATERRNALAVIALLGGLLGIGCDSSSEPDLAPTSAEPSDDVADGGPCDRFCADVEDACTGKSSCRDDCEDWLLACKGSTEEFLDCARNETIDCDVADSAYVPACGSEWEQLSRCLDPEPSEAFEPCRTNEDCVEGLFCLPTADPAFRGGWLCTPACDRDAECFSGCCGTLDTGEELCGFPADCAPVSVGNPCLTNDDCESGDCRWGSCVVECESDADCGANVLGLANHCHRETRDDGTVQSACLPGCSEDADCRFYFENPYYTYDVERDRIPLECIEGPSGKYCY